jgi:chemotaxis receptor (MCP) glutamine deamidase CheD
MSAPAPEIVVQPDAFRVSREPLLLVCQLSSALAVCLHDPAQQSGGLLHLRYVATRGSAPLDLTDNTLSSDLLLMDRFCKEMRSAGARKQSWRVRIFGHTPDTPGMQAPAATVIDLAKAYFADARLAVECQEFRCSAPVTVRLLSHTGDLWAGSGGQSPAAGEADSAR